MPEPGLSPDDILEIRSRHLSDSCRVHFMESPLKIVRSKGQYMFNEHGEKFLDCTSRTSAIGHCHPDVVAAACKQMAKLSVSSADNDEYRQYSSRLLSTLPPKFEACFFTNSGGEANDLALLLAQRFTGRTGVAVVDGAFHGAVVSLMDVSPKAFRVSPEGQKPWVHVIPCPNLNRIVDDNNEERTKTCISDAIRVLEDAKEHKHKISCFICEPLMVVPGVIVPPKGWLKGVYSAVQSRGGLVISDEIVTGLGRIGSHFWAFQALADGALPDIVTIGKPLGNGHPMAAVLTTSNIAQVLSKTEHLAYYRCGPVEAAIGLKVLQVLKEEGLVHNAMEVGRYLKQRLEDLKCRHPNIGDVRGVGLIVGVEIVRDGNTPAPDLAQRFSYRLKDRKVIVGPEGENENVLAFLPPYCLTRDDVNHIIQVFEEILLEIDMDQNVYSFLGDDDDDDGNHPRISWFHFQESSPQSSSSGTSIDYQSLD